MICACLWSPNRSIGCCGSAEIEPGFLTGIGHAACGHPLLSGIHMTTLRQAKLAAIRGKESPSRSRYLGTCSMDAGMLFALGKKMKAFAFEAFSRDSRASPRILKLCRFALAAVKMGVAPTFLAVSPHLDLIIPQSTGISKTPERPSKFAETLICTLEDQRPYKRRSGFGNIGLQIVVVWVEGHTLCRYTVETFASSRELSTTREFLRQTSNNMVIIGKWDHNIGN